MCALIGRYTKTSTKVILNFHWSKIASKLPQRYLIEVECVAHLLRRIDYHWQIILTLFFIKQMLVAVRQLKIRSFLFRFFNLAIIHFSLLKDMSLMLVFSEAVQFCRRTISDHLPVACKSCCEPFEKVRLHSVCFHLINLFLYCISASY